MGLRLSDGDGIEFPRYAAGFPNRVADQAPHFLQVHMPRVRTR